MKPPKKPRRRLPNIAAFRVAGAWKWRARIKVDRAQRVGQLRDTQEEAHADVRALRSRHDAIRRGDIVTLGEALDAVIAQAKERSDIEPASVRNGYEFPAKAIKTFWAASDALAAIDADEVAWMIQEALARGLSATTLRKAYLPMLSRAFKVAGLQDPVPDARKTAKLRGVRKPMPWFTPAELGPVLRRIREWKGPRECPRQEEDADIIEVMAYTAVRSTEFCRVLVRDVRVEQGVGYVHVRLAKDRANPRTLVVPAVGVPLLERLTAGRDPDEPLVRGGARRLNHMFEAWKKRLKEPRLNGRALRHSAATTTLLTGGIDPDVKRLLGHSPTSTESVRYTHAVEEHVNQTSAKIADAYRAEEDE